MLDFKKTVEEIKNSDVFKEWCKENKSNYLCNGFLIIGEDSWQVGFYNKEKDSITCFFIKDQEVKILEEDSRIFKKKGMKVEELRLDKIKIELMDVLKIVNDLKNEKYKEEKENKIIVIVQKIKKPIWNVTYLSEKFNILNVRVDAKSGKILKESLSPALSFKA